MNIKTNFAEKRPKYTAKKEKGYNLAFSKREGSGLSRCECCGREGGSGKYYEWGNLLELHEQYQRDFLISRQSETEPSFILKR